MNGKQLMRHLLISYPVIYGGGMMATWLCCSIYDPDSIFDLTYFSQMFLVALLGDLTMLIFYSRKELSGRRYLIRMGIHIVVLEITLLAIGYYMNFYNQLNEALIFSGTVFFVYILVISIIFTTDMIEAQRINEHIKKLRQ